mgnify:CR=1 FL=1
MNHSGRHWWPLVLAVLLMLSACQPGLLPQEQEDVADDVTPHIISPVADVSEIDYRGVLPYAPVAYAGLSKLNDLERGHMERAMFEAAVNRFAPEKHLFQEGQWVTRQEGAEWVESLNATLGHPFVLGFLEHDYLTEQGELAGMVLGVAVTTGYIPEIGSEPASPVRFSEEDLRRMSQTVADDLTRRLRQKTDVPLVFLLVTHEMEARFVPGGVFLQGEVAAGEHRVERWTEVHEEWMLLPHPRGGQGAHQVDVHRSFQKLQEKIETYFPKYAGVTGMARFQKEQLVEVTVEINAEYDSEAQITQLAQYVIAMLPEWVAPHVRVNVYIRSLNMPQAVYVRQSDGREFFHLYRQ